MTERLGAGSISRWVGILRARGAVSDRPDPDGDTVEEAARALWGRFFRRMVGLARVRLRASRAGDAAVDGEDVALSAFESFCEGATRGRFPDLFDRDDLWRLLVVITTRKALSESRRQNRQKRGGGLVRNETDVAALDDEDELLSLAVGTEPTPETAALVLEQYRLLLDHLADDTLRQVAVWRMEGYTGDEIAAKLGCAAADRRPAARPDPDHLARRRRDGLLTFRLVELRNSCSAWHATPADGHIPGMRATRLPIGPRWRPTCPSTTPTLPVASIACAASSRTTGGTVAIPRSRRC